MPLVLHNALHLACPQSLNLHHEGSDGKTHANAMQPSMGRLAGSMTAMKGQQLCVGDQQQEGRQLAMTTHSESCECAALWAQHNSIQHIQCMHRGVTASAHQQHLECT